MEGGRESAWPHQPLFTVKRFTPVVVTGGKGLKPQVLEAHGSGASPHMLACSSTSPAEKCNWQIGHWTQEMGDELSEDTHRTDGEAGGDEEGEAG